MLKRGAVMKARVRLGLLSFSSGDKTGRLHQAFLFFSYGSRSRMCVPTLWWPAGLSKLTEMNLPAEGWACSAVLLRGAHTRADIKLFQEVISLLFFTTLPNTLDLMLSCTHPCRLCQIDLQYTVDREGGTGIQKTLNLSWRGGNHQKPQDTISSRYLSHDTLYWF